MQWGNSLGLYNAKAIRRTKKRAKVAIKRLTVDELRREIDKRTPRKEYRQEPQYRPGMGKEFYLTREWREARYETITKHGRACQCCGQTAGYMHVDHIKPRSIHPELELDRDNLQVLCEACNIGKGNKDATDWRK